MAHVEGRSTGRFSALMALDALTTAFAYMLAVVVRFEGLPPAEWLPDIRAALPVLVASRLVVLWLMKMHRWSFFLSGLEEAVRLGVATVGGTVLFVVVWFGIHGHGLPVSIVLLELLLTSALLAVIRYSPRFTASFLGERLDDGRQKAIIVGAGSAGDLLLRDIRRSPEKRIRVVGFVDDSPHKKGFTLGGKAVLGTIDDLPERHQEARRVAGDGRHHGASRRAAAPDAGALRRLEGPIQDHPGLLHPDGRQAQRRHAARPLARGPPAPRAGRLRPEGDPGQGQRAAHPDHRRRRLHRQRDRAAGGGPPVRQAGPRGHERERALPATPARSRPSIRS